MILNESIIEEAALEWFGKQSRFAPTLIPAFSQREKEEEGEVECLRKAIRRLNPAIPEEARATHKESLSVQIERWLNP